MGISPWFVGSCRLVVQEDRKVGSVRYESPLESGRTPSLYQLSRIVFHFRRHFEPVQSALPYGLRSRVEVRDEPTLEGDNFLERRSADMRDYLR